MEYVDRESMNTVVNEETIICRPNMRQNMSIDEHPKNQTSNKMENFSVGLYNRLHISIKVHIFQKQLLLNLNQIKFVIQYFLPL